MRVSRLQEKITWPTTRGDGAQIPGQEAWRLQASLQGQPSAIGGGGQIHWRWHRISWAIKSDLKERPGCIHKSISDHASPTRFYQRRALRTAWAILQYSSACVEPNQAGRVLLCAEIFAQESACCNGRHRKSLPTARTDAWNLQHSHASVGPSADHISRGGPRTGSWSQGSAVQSYLRGRCQRFRWQSAPTGKPQTLHRYSVKCQKPLRPCCNLHADESKDQQMQLLQWTHIICYIVVLIILLPSCFSLAIW